MRRAAPAFALSASLLATSPLAAQWEPPPVAVSRETFEAAYPKTTVSAAVLALETLSAALGNDMSPEDPERPHPDAEAAKAARASIGAVSSWVGHELEDPGERVGAPDASAAAYLSANAATIDRIVSVAAGSQEIAWDLDVARGSNAPVPNWLGVFRLQRILAARALLDVRNGNPDEALTVVEGMWRICEALAARPELISQLIVLAQARYAEGVLRKIPAPAYGWSDRLREQGLYHALLTALQNDPWTGAEDPARAEHAATRARVTRRFVEGLMARSVCEWTRDELAHEWEVAGSGEGAFEEDVNAMASEAVVDMLLRSNRFLLDSEMTALIVEARIDKSAARDGQWPEKLPNLESAVCPGRFYTYRRAGAALLEFPGPVPKSDRQGQTLPVTFRGAPPPTPTPTPTKPRPVLTPTPPAHRLLGR